MWASAEESDAGGPGSALKAVMSRWMALVTIGIPTNESVETGCSATALYPEYSFSKLQSLRASGL